MDERMDLSSVEKMLFARAAQTNTPIYGGFELTPYCNLACKMCYIRAQKPGLPVMDAQTWLSFGRQAAKAGTLVVQLTGGEPMLHPQFRQIYAGLKALGMVLTMNTNATLIDEDMADFLAADMPRRVNVSLYGSGAASYERLCGNGNAFDRVIRAIELMRVRGIPVKINLTVSTVNYPDLDGILAICRQYDLPIEMTTYMFEPVRQMNGGRQQCRLSPDQMADAMFRQFCYRQDTRGRAEFAAFARGALAHFDPGVEDDDLAPLDCRAGSSSYWLCWDGRMNGCACMTQPRADVRELGFDAAWAKVMAHTRTIRVPARCRRCSLSMFCENCGAVTLHETGSFSKMPKIPCEAAKALAGKIAHCIEDKTEESI